MPVTFGRFRLDTAARLLTRDGREIRLSPKAFDLLAFLVDRHPAVLDKATLRDRLWPSTHVVDASLSNLVAEIRAASAELGARLRTVHGVGYAFTGDVDTDGGEVVVAPAAPPCWVVWRDQRIPLAPGENLVGRDRGCAVWIDESGVSRRHARIHVPPAGPDAAGGVTIEDLDSTNGTYLRRQAVTTATRLADGDTVRIGPELLRFQSRAATDAPTKRVRRRAGRER